VPGLTQTVTSATLLAGAKKLTAAKTGAGIVIAVPEKAPDNIASVIKLVVKGKIAEKQFTGKAALGKLTG
jgi:alpha-L-fucosidase